MMDVRTAISSRKHYINAPIPLFLHLCSLDITRAQENIFWLHWGEGQMHGDWKSAIPIKTVADRLKLSVSTVKRAYADLEALGLIRRHRQGRSIRDPMRMAVTVTEVTIPQDVAEELMEAPDRAKKVTHNSPSGEPEDTAPTIETEPLSAPVAPSPRRTVPKYEAIHDEDESSVPVSSSWYQEQEMLSAEREQAIHVHEPVEAYPAETFPSPRAGGAADDDEFRAPTPEIMAIYSQKRRQIHPGMAFKLLRAIRNEESNDQLAKTCWHQMLWSLEYGFFAEDPVKKAYNIMMRQLRRRRWFTPLGMPLGWKWSAT